MASNPIPDLCSECRGIEAQIARLLQIIASPIADPAGVALVRLAIAPQLGPAFEWHCALWPVTRIAREWVLFKTEIEAMFINPERAAA